MPRLHLFELGDQAWCPKAFRDAETDILEFFLRIGNYYAPIVPRLMAALEKTREREIVDLCSGSGGPWLRLLSEFGEKSPISVLLTDKYPNALGAQRVADASQGRIRSELRSVDATAVPRDLRGFRTLFSSFHHFRPSAARAILADAVNNRVGIGIFEFTERSLVGGVVLALTPIGVLFAVPFLRPMRWQTLLLTYVVPVLPLGALFDGVVSCLRTYSPRELSELVEPLRGEGYTWEIGQARSWRSPIPVTYLLGYPSDDRGQDGAASSTRRHQLSGLMQVFFVIGAVGGWLLASVLAGGVLPALSLRTFIAAFYGGVLGQVAGFALMAGMKGAPGKSEKEP